VSVTVHFRDGKAVVYNAGQFATVEGEWIRLMDKSRYWVAFVPASAVKRVDGVEPCRVFRPPRPTPAHTPRTRTKREARSVALMRRMIGRQLQGLMKWARRRR
jgi:hypothetical protein